MAINGEIRDCLPKRSSIYPQLFGKRFPISLPLNWEIGFSNYSIVSKMVSFFPCISLRKRSPISPPIALTKFNGEEIEYRSSIRSPISPPFWKRSPISPPLRKRSRISPPLRKRSRISPPLRKRSLISPPFALPNLMVGILDTVPLNGH